MDPATAAALAAIAAVIRDLTLTGALAFAVVGLILGVVRSGRLEDKRMSDYAAERDKRDEVLLATSKQWQDLYLAEAKRADEADDRTTQITEAFRTALDQSRPR